MIAAGEVWAEFCVGCWVLVLVTTTGASEVDEVAVEVTTAWLDGVGVAAVVGSGVDEGGGVEGSVLGSVLGSVVGSVVGSGVG